MNTILTCAIISTHVITSCSYNYQHFASLRTLPVMAKFHEDRREAVSSKASYSASETDQGAENA